MPGRPPKPASLKLIQGSRNRSPSRSAEPDPTYLNDLTAPAHLDEAARKVWDELAPRLRQSRLLTELDTVTLELTCVAIANHRTASNLSQGKLLTKNAETGSVSASPYLIVQSMAFKQAMLGLAKFGMSPQDRARVVVNPQAALFDDPSAKYFS